MTVTLRGVEPRSDGNGVTAILSMELCNPNNAELRVDWLGVEYRPGDHTSPGVDWEVKKIGLGAGYCDDRRVQSEPLGELVRFRADDGFLRVRSGAGDERLLHLPLCIPPTPVPSPTPPPAVVSVELPELDYSSPRMTTLPLLLELSAEGIPTVEVYADEDELLEVRFGKRGDGEEHDTLLGDLPAVEGLRALVGKLPPIEGRPTCIVVGDTSRRVFLLAVVSADDGGGYRYLTAVEPVELESDRGLRRRGYKVLVRKGETFHLVAFVAGDPKPDIPVEVRRFPFATPTPAPSPADSPTPSPTPRPTRTPPPTPTATPICERDPFEVDDPRHAHLLGTGRHTLHLCRQPDSTRSSGLPVRYRDVDWFRVEAAKGREIWAEAAFAGSEAEVELRLEAAPTISARPLAKSSREEKDLRALRFKSRSEEVYYLAVLLIAGGVATPANVDYDLRLFDGLPPPCEDDREEPNDARGDATAIRNGTSQHRLCPRYNFLGLPKHEEHGYVDVDWYELSGSSTTADRHVEVLLSWPRLACNLDLALYVRDRGVSLVAASSTWSGTEEAVSHPHTRERRTYYVLVKLESSPDCLDGDVEYTMTVRGSDK